MVVCIYIYTWVKVREHLLCYEGKLWTKFVLQSKYVFTKLFNLSKSVVSKVASALKLRISSNYCGWQRPSWIQKFNF